MSNKIDISISVSEAVLNSAMPVLDKLKISLNDAVDLYLAMIAETGSIPLHFGNGPIKIDAPHAKISTDGRIIPPDSWWDEDDFDDEP